MTFQIFDLSATVDCSIAVIKKTAKVSGSNNGFKSVLPRKKRRGDVLKDSSDGKVIGSEIQNSHSWGSETNDTTESDSIDMEEECLVEKTSFRQESREEFSGVDTDITPKDPKRIITKRTLGKPLGTINFDMENDDDNDILDGKSFALDIDLGVVVGKSSQKKLAYVRKIFFGVNGFGGASTPLKFGGIIRASFTSNKAMMAAAKLANDHDVMVNTNLKRPNNNHTNQTIVLKEIPVEISVETVHMAVSKFGVIKMIKMQLNQADLLVAKCFRALLYTLPIETTTHDLWDFIGSVGEKTCFIDCNSVSYSRAHCATVCFDSELDLVGAMTATPVIKSVNLHWSHLSQALCAVCIDFGHTSLNCQSIKDAMAPDSRKTLLLAQDQIRLAKIYVKKSALISHPLAFSGKTWASVVGTPSVHASHSAGMFFGFNKIGELLPLVVDNLELHLVGIESSLVSFVEQISKLAKRLESLVLANQEEDIVMGLSLGEATSDKIVPIVDSTASPHVVKLEKMLNGLSKSVLSLSVCFNSLALAGDATSLTSSQ
ncbi:hypothetical protein G9A89_021214 [Geosiphon pyriformis]|nr:hypothetical protein G9A89_021214 [Geosiphon pyriformis]